MSKLNFNIPKKTEPKIYGYIDLYDPSKKGYIKIGETARDLETRINEQYPSAGLIMERPYKIVFCKSSIRKDGSIFHDKQIHKLLDSKNFQSLGREFWKCDLKDLEAAFNAVKNKEALDLERNLNFEMRPEQKQAVELTTDYFKKIKKENFIKKTPKFLWNAKMRFGKTFASYKLIENMGWKKILILTYKPAVESAWKEDISSHIDFKKWQYHSSYNESLEDPLKRNKEFPMVCFGSYQDYLGKNKYGGIKAKNEWAHALNWDCVILDEYHFGSWRENAWELFDSDDFSRGDNEDQLYASDKDKNLKVDYFDTDTIPITTDHFLCLSGTPFRAISDGEFIEEQIFNWTYSDEQNAKINWQGDKKNPYLSLPKMNLLTYKLPDSVTDIALRGEYDEFDLNIFFSAIGEGDNAKFKYEDEVQKWLDIIRGSYIPSDLNDFNIGYKKPPMPFSDTSLLQILTHTFWYLPRVASCFAMRNLLEKRNNIFYHDYKIIVAAGSDSPTGSKALKPVYDAMDNPDPTKTKTITLSCQKLNSGVSVKPWSGVFMLRNLKAPETYFQTAFRVQTPWTIKDVDNFENEIILKNDCYVFDFAPNRALSQIAEYSCKLNVKESNPEKKVAEFIKFLPVLSFDGNSMSYIDAAGILDMAMSGTTASLLARRWDSDRLINVDDFTLKKLLNNAELLKSLMKIEGFRNINQDLDTIINKSDNIKDVKTGDDEDKNSDKKKKEISEEESKLKSLRKELKDKLKKFSSRIPVFIYLTDYREMSLEDVILKIDPPLFKKVTSLSIDDFDQMVSIGIFNKPLMNDAVYKFKRYEDASLSYSGLEIERAEVIGGFDSVISKKDFDDLYE